MKTLFTTLRLGTMARIATSLAAAALLTTGSAQAQVIYNLAANGDNSGTGGTGATGVSNTGCEVAYYGIDVLLRAFTWDTGSGAYLGWVLGSNKGSAPLLGTGAEDPDVVVDPGSTSNGGKGSGKMLVTYLRNGSVYYEVRQVNGAGTTLTTIKGSTIVNTAGAGLCSNPNVDVNNDGEALIVWEQSGAIYARTFALAASTSSTNLGSVYRVTSAQANYSFSQPDVAINRNTNNGSTAVVPSFVYVATDLTTGTQTLRMSQPAMTNVRAGSGSGLAGTNVYVGSGALETPRIAAAVNYAGMGSYGYEVVLTDLDGAGNKIIGLNNSSSSSAVSVANLPAASVLNINGDGTTPLYALATCERPVVTYNGDAILVAWTLLDGGSVPPTFQGNKDVIKVNLSYMKGDVIGNGYSVVDKSTTGDQYVPSIAGRLTSFTLGGTNLSEALYAFFDENVGDVLWKSSYYFNTNLRPTATTAAPKGKGTGTAQLTAPATRGTERLEAYPNPFHGTATFNLGLREGEHVRSLEVYSTTGQRVSTVALPTEQSAPTVSFDAVAAGLTPGLYLVRLTTDQGTQNLRLHYE
jgi:hypothetical protein